MKRVDILRFGRTSSHVTAQRLAILSDTHESSDDDAYCYAGATPSSEREPHQRAYSTILVLTKSSIAPCYAGEGGTRRIVLRLMGILMLLMHNLVPMQPVDSRLNLTLHNSPQGNTTSVC